VVGNQPFYAAIGVDLGGHRDVLGLWAGKGGGESAKFWMNVLTDLKNRGVTDVFFIVCDGLKGLPDAVNSVFPAAIVQACVIHLIRATLRYASRKYWDQLAKDLRAIYTAPSVEAAWAAFEELEEKWGKPYPAIPRLWRAAWEEFTPFLAYGACREMGCGTDIEEDRVRTCGHQRLSRPQAGLRCARSGGCAVDLQQIEGGGGEVDLAECVVQAAA
jgi:transposase-like protein